MRTNLSKVKAQQFVQHNGLFQKLETTPKEDKLI